MLIMTLAKALDELKAGKKIRRHDWPRDVYLVDYEQNGNVQDVNGRLFKLTDLLKDDWDVEQDPYGFMEFKM